MMKPEHLNDVTCPTTGKPCETLVSMVDQYTRNHDVPEVTDEMKLDDLEQLSRVTTGYGALRSCMQTKPVS